MASALSSWSPFTHSGDIRTGKSDLHQVTGKTTQVWNLPGEMTLVIEPGHQEHLRTYLVEMVAEAFELAGIDLVGRIASALRIDAEQNDRELNEVEARRAATYALGSLTWSDDDVELLEVAS